MPIDDRRALLSAHPAVVTCAACLVQLPIRQIFGCSVDKVKQHYVFQYLVGYEEGLHNTVQFQGGVIRRNQSAKGVVALSTSTHLIARTKGQGSLIVLSRQLPSNSWSPNNNTSTSTACGSRLPASYVDRGVYCASHRLTCADYQYLRLPGISSWRLAHVLLYQLSCNAGFISCKRTRLLLMQLAWLAVPTMWVPSTVGGLLEMRS